LRPPAQVLLGDRRLVVVASALPASGSPDDAPSVWSTTDWSLPLVGVGPTSGGGSLSRDGQRLAFTGCAPDGDKLVCESLETLAPDGHWGTQLPAPPTSVSTDSGPSSHIPATVWISTALDGTPYVGVQSPLFEGAALALTGLGQPMWVHVEDGLLTWLSLSTDGRATLVPSRSTGYSRRPDAARV
jgi:hypothetical protein